MATAVVACGGDPGARGNADLGLRLQWQQPAGTSGGTLVADCPFVPPSAGFGPTIPSTVNTVRIIVESADTSCCVAVRRGSSAFDQRSVVLTQLSEGAATVRVAGFVSDAAPDDGITQTCVVKPTGHGEPCAPVECTSAGFDGSTDVVLEAGNQTETGPVGLCDNVFGFGPQPSCDGSVAANPVPVDLVVADGAGLCECSDDVFFCGGDGNAPFSVAFDATVVQKDTVPIAHACAEVPAPDAERPLPLTISCCPPQPVCCPPSDPACGTPEARCCVDGVRPLPTTGTQLSGLAQGLVRGCAAVRVYATRPETEERRLVFENSFLVLADPPTVTPSATATPSPSPTATATQTPRIVIE